MKLTTIILLFLSSSFAAVSNPYAEDAGSHEYMELYREFRSFVIAVLIANRNRKDKMRFKRNTTSCENRCGEERSHTFYTHCDANCMLIQDCSYDYLKVCKPNRTISRAEREKWRCVSDLYKTPSNYLHWVDNKDAKVPRIKGHIMIASCSNYSRDLEEKCLKSDHDNVADSMPVEGPDGNTYKNKFCALGNGIREKNIKSWRFELICYKTEKYNETAKIQKIINSCLNENQNCLCEDKAFLRDKCTWYYTPPLNITKKHTVCSPVKSCPDTPDTMINMTVPEYTKLRLKCQAYMSVVHHNGTYYKNPHCALCFGIKPTDLHNPPMLTFNIPTISFLFEIPKPNHIKESNTNDSDSTTGEKTASELEFYFNLIGISVSTVTLLFLLALYSLFKELRTTPGKIILSLSTSILIYQTVLLVSPQFTNDAVACSITAIILHFAILSCFAWMSVMAFDVWKTFGRNNQQRIQKKSSAFLYYFFYAIINPLVIVLIAISLDRGEVMMVYWGNGDSHSCWIVRKLPHILFFKIPVGIGLGLNLVAFIWTVFRITSVRNKSIKYSSTIHSHETSKNMKMYWKMSVVMGLTWILGFCMEYSVTLRLIYVIVNSLQGFFIFLAFVTNKRVVEKCQGARPSWTTRSHSQGSNTRKTSSGSNM